MGPYERTYFQWFYHPEESVFYDNELFPPDPDGFSIEVQEEEDWEEDIPMRCPDCGAALYPEEWECPVCGWNLLK